MTVNEPMKPAMIATGRQRERPPEVPSRKGSTGRMHRARIVRNPAAMARKKSVIALFLHAAYARDGDGESGAETEARIEPDLTAQEPHVLARGEQAQPRAMRVLGDVLAAEEFGEDERLLLVGDADAAVHHLEDDIELLGLD